MNLNRLHQILRETTILLRKGDEVESDDPQLVSAVKNFKEGNDICKLPGGTVHIYAMPHETQLRDGIEKVDLHFVVVGVYKAKAEQIKEELIAILRTYPHPERLAGGLFYIEMGGEIGDQGAALQLFALGKVLELWDVVTPEKLGITGPEANQMAGMGLVMMGGFQPS